MCGAVVLRIQDVLENGGNIEGYRKALGSNTIEFFKANPDMNIHEYGIRIEDKPDDESRARLLAFMQSNLQQGLIEMEDAILIETTDNLKVAQQVLAYKIRKRKEDLEAKAMRQQQQNGQIQMQSAQAAEQAKQQTLKLKQEGDMQIEQLKAQLQMEMQKQKFEFEMQMKQMAAEQEGIKMGVGMQQEQMPPENSETAQNVQ